MPGLKTTSSADPPREVDVIIVGGGAAGCVVAGRLAGADPSLEIAVVEGGIDNKTATNSHQPALYISHLAPTSTTAAFYKAKASKHVNDREVIVPIGAMLGGGSSINFMMYTRGSESDYNGWEQEGWSWDELLPLMKSTETNHLPGLADEVHGSDGPLHVTYGGHQSSLGKEFLDAAGEACPEIPFQHDIQDGKTANAKTNWGKWIHPKTGRRQDTAHGYLHPAVNKSEAKVHVLCECTTTRVIFDDSTPPKAVGIEYIANPLARAQRNPEQPPEAGEKFQIRARKYVVVSAGAFGTPLILERSGVGNKEILEKAGVDVVVDLPGVGKVYDDHQLALQIYTVDKEADTHDELLRGNPELHAVEGPKWASTGQGAIASNAIDAGIKFRPTEEEVDAMNSPEFRKYWDSFFKSKPDTPIVIGGLVGCFLGDHSLLPPGDRFIMVGQYDMHRKSRGHLHITSSDPFAAPDFDAGYLADPADIAVHVWIWAKLREVIRRMPSYRGELLGPNFPEGSEAKCLNAEEAQAHLKAGNIKDIKYTEEDKKAIEEWVRTNIGTTWHSMSTCPMKAREDGGVCDNRLNVYGTQNLKLADLSICPKNVASNTYSVALTVGEKAASILAQDLGLKVNWV